MRVANVRMALGRIIGVGVLAAVGTLAAAGTAHAAAPRPTASNPHTQAVREVNVVFVNYTVTPLTRAGGVLDHGEWNMFPPEQIQGLSRAYWGTESNGFATGTEASINYGTPFGNVWVHWNNPFVGENSFDCITPPGLSCVSLGGGGSTADVTFLLNYQI